MNESYIPDDDRVDVIGKLKNRLDDLGDTTLREAAEQGADDALEKELEVLKPFKDDGEKEKEDKETPKELGDKDVKEVKEEGQKDEKEVKEEGQKEDKEVKEDKETKEVKDEGEKDEKDAGQKEQSEKEQGEKDTKEVKDVDDKDGGEKEHGEKEPVFEGPPEDEPSAPDAGPEDVLDDPRPVM